MNANPDRLIALAERLTRALEDDIAALERGRPREMRTIEPEIQQLAALFARESAAVNVAAVKSLPADKRSKLTDTTRRFQEALSRQTRMIKRMKSVSEGMIHAIAEDVARKKTAMRPYAPTAFRPRSPGAMVYNAIA